MLMNGRGIGGVMAGVLVCAALLQSACGGGEDKPTDKPTVSIRSVPTTPKSAAGEKQARTAREKPATGSRPRPDSASTGLSGGQAARLRDAIERLPVSKRDRIVGQVVRAVVARFGFTSASVATTGPGRVRVSIPAGTACGATPNTQEHLSATVRKGVPWVDSLQVVVGSSGRSLSEYVRSNCKSSSPPAGSGPVVLTEDGVGLATTRTFQIKSPRWSIEYVNVGTRLQILPLKNGAPIGSIGIARRGRGRRMVKGSGRFSLQIGSAGEWMVRVRDGA